MQRGAQEQAAREEADGAPPLPRLHVGPFRVGPLGLLVGVLLLVGVGSLVRFGADRTPDLPRSCTVDGLALSAQRVQPGGLVEYSVSGPDGEVLLSVVPRSADPATARAVQVLPTETLSRCRATGRFGLQAPPGEHSVIVRRAGQRGRRPGHHGHRAGRPDRRLTHPLGGPGVPYARCVTRYADSLFAAVAQW